MELKDLSPDEVVALAALIWNVVLADLEISADEEAEIAKISAELGEDRYRKALDEAAKRFPDDAKLQVFLRTINRQEARELILGTVMEAALMDAVTPEENQLLAWLQKEWGVDVSVEPPPEG